MSITSDLSVHIEHPTVTFTYDGDGNRVKKDEDSVVTHYPGRHYESTIGSGSTKYYYAGGQLIAFERSPEYGINYGRRFVFRDHLGSTSVIVNDKGEKLWEDRFYPFGDVRYTYRKGDDPSFPLQTQYRYTSQWFEDGLGASAENGLDRGLYFYGARWYDSSLGRFVQPDTIVPEPGNPQSLNRYSYSANNPLRFVDPTGHLPIPPPIAPIRRILNHPYVKPLWTNPQIGGPVVYGMYREAKGDAPEALSLTVDWYFERGDARREIGDESEITQHLKRDEGVQEAREVFVEGGGKDMVGIGRDAYEHHFDSEFFVEMPKAVFSDDWSGSFLGGYHVEFRNQEGYDGSGQLVKITVINDTGWASGTHIPRTDITLRANEPRYFPGPGGTLWQYYTWREVIHVDGTN